jgi:hypothetical protein
MVRSAQEAAQGEHPVDNQPFPLRQVLSHCFSSTLPKGPPPQNDGPKISLREKPVAVLVSYILSDLYIFHIVYKTIICTSTHMTTGIGVITHEVMKRGAASV